MTRVDTTGATPLNAVKPYACLCLTFHYDPHEPDEVYTVIYYAPRREATVVLDRDSSGTAAAHSVASFDSRATIERPRRFARHR